ncbi:MAG: RDD family protein [Planctomycetaceae bacterium]
MAVHSLSADRQPLDTTLTVVSPENIAFQFRLAGPAARAMAFLLDALVIVSALAAVLVAFGTLGVVAEAFMGLFLVAVFFVWWGYGAACEVLANGRTAGKAALGLRVVSQTGLSINPAQAILRNLLRAVDVAPPFFPGVVSMACTRRLQRLGDLAAGTMVVLDRSRGVPRPPRADAETADMIPAGFVADPRLVEALAAYVSRRPDLSPGRRQELAGLVADRLCAAWDTLPPRDADALVCGLYERAIATSSLDDA